MLPKIMPQPEILKDKMPSCYSRCSACAWEYNDFHSPIWITAFRNGDKHHYGTRFLVSPARQRNFEGLLDSLTKRLEPPFGAVRKVYSPCSGNTVKCLKDLKPNHKYVAAGKESLRKMSTGYLTYDEKFKKRHTCNHKRVEIYRPENGKSLRERYSNVQSKYLEDAERRRRGTITIFVHKNGDFDNRPVRFVLSEKDRTSLYWWGPTMQSIASKLQMSSIRGFFTRNGEAVHIPCHIQHGDIYVAVSRMEKFQKGPYKKTEMAPKIHHNNTCLGHLSVCSSDSESEQMESSSDDEETTGGNDTKRSSTKPSNVEKNRKKNNAEGKKLRSKEGKIKPTYIRTNRHEEVSSNQDHKCIGLEEMLSSRQLCYNNHECHHKDRSSLDDKMAIYQEDYMAEIYDNTEVDKYNLESKDIIDSKTKEYKPETCENTNGKEENSAGISSDQVKRPIYAQKISIDDINILPADEKPSKKKESQSRTDNWLCFPLCHKSSTSINHNNTNKDMSFTDQLSECEGLCPTDEMTHPTEPQVRKNEQENNMTIEETFEVLRGDQEDEMPCPIEEIVTHSCHGLIEPKSGSSHHSVVHYSTTIVFRKENESDELSCESKLSQELPLSQDPSTAEETQEKGNSDSHAVVSCCDCYLLHHQEETPTECNHGKKKISLKKAKSQTDDAPQASEIVHQTKIPSKTFDEVKATQTTSLQKDVSQVCLVDAHVNTCHRVCSNCAMKEMSAKEEEVQNDDKKSKERKRRGKTKRPCCACFPLSKREDSSYSVKDASTETIPGDSFGETARKLSLKEAEMQTEGEHEESQDWKRKRKSKRPCCACFPSSKGKESLYSVKDASTETNITNNSVDTARKLSLKESEMQTEGEFEEFKEGKRKRKSKSCCGCFPLSQREDSSVSVQDASTEANIVDTSDKTAKKISIKEAASQTDDDKYKSSPAKVEEADILSECSTDEEVEENITEVPVKEIVSWYELQNEKIYMRKARGINNIIFLYKYKPKTPQNRRLYSSDHGARKENNNEFLFGIKSYRKSKSSVKKRCKKSHMKKRRGKVISRPYARWDWGKKQRGSPLLQKSEPSLSVPYTIGYVRSSGKKTDHLIFENSQKNTEEVVGAVIDQTVQPDVASEAKQENKADVKKVKPIPSVRTPRPKTDLKKRANNKRPIAKTTKSVKILEEEYLQEKFEPYSGDESDSNQKSN